MFTIEDGESAGQALREFRKSTGLTQFELAAAVAMSRARLSLVEQGKANITLVGFLRLTNAMGAQLVIEPPALNSSRRRRRSGSG